ncbi:MAG: PAS domain-containing sensor histidine kinase [Rhodobacteraceae bacterium]|nr:PAS domain-containing sensor histidine kinase [Paracoccaceae bacterium]
MQQSILITANQRFQVWQKKRIVRNYLVVFLVVVGPVLALTTVLSLGFFEGAAKPQMLRAVLLADVVYTLLIATLVARRIMRMISARRNRSAGSQLHLRLTGVFSFIALVPTVLVAIFATITLNFGLEGWFSDRVRQVVSNSLAAAEAYESEHLITLTNDAQLLARFIDQQRSTYRIVGAGEMRDALSRGQIAMQRALAEAYVINGDAKIISRGQRSYLFTYEAPTVAEIERAVNGEIVLIEDWPNSEFRALIKLDNYLDRFLFVSRNVDGDILNLLDDTQETVVLYQQLESDRGKLLFEFALIYLGFAVVVILAAIWLGLWFADKLSRPMGRLASAAQQVSDGNMDVQVREEEGDDEIALLGRVFNKMVTQVKGQRDTLIANNEETEQRRRLFDSVLSGVTAGVIGLDKSGCIEIANAAAIELLTQSDAMIGVQLDTAVPEFAPLFEKLKRRVDKVVRAEIQLTRENKDEKLLVRIATRQADDQEVEGYVVTFDDVTELVSAQRMAAWGDVAQRIAHEIKNPLTPIQLSAERLKRKFGPKLNAEDRESLEQLSSVIIRQTNDLRRIVDEFSKFARMPEPDRRHENLTRLVRDAVLLQQTGQPDVQIVADIPDTAIDIEIDATMISQALTNLIKNAGEAIETYTNKGAEDGFQPQIEVTLKQEPDDCVITIADNGVGLPEDRARLFEPYVTTRSEGTGLGLPIVKKIIEEHGGTLVLQDAPVFAGHSRFGAMAVIRLPSTDFNTTENEQEKQG